MYQFLIKLTPVFIAFFMLLNLPVHAKDYAHDYATSEVDLYNSAYDLCLVKAAEDGDDFMGFLQTQEDFSDFCGCAAEIAVDVYNEDLSDSELDVIIEERTLQCLQPHIKPFITNTCLAAAADSGIIDVTQKCDCFGENVEAQSANNISDFFDDPDKYLDASAKFCGLVD